MEVSLFEIVGYCLLAAPGDRKFVVCAGVSCLKGLESYFYSVIVLVIAESPLLSNNTIRSRSKGWNEGQKQSKRQIQKKVRSDFGLSLGRVWWRI